MRGEDRTGSGVEPQLVSVVVPVYDGAAYLAEAIESARAQAYRPIEVVVVDDGSTDGSAEVARSFGSSVSYAHKENAGLSSARNTGLGLARGDLVAFLDADDVWLPKKLAAQVALLVAESLDLVFGHVEEFVSPGTDAGLVRPAAAPMPGYLPSTALVRADAFSRVGPFDTGLTVAEWVDWYARAAEAGLRVGMVPDVVTRRRLHGENHGIRQRQARNDYLHVLKASLDRRRAGAGS